MASGPCLTVFLQLMIFMHTRGPAAPGGQGAGPARIRQSELSVMTSTPGLDAAGRTLSAVLLAVLFFAFADAL